MTPEERAASEYIAGRYPEADAEFKERIRQAFLVAASWLRDKTQNPQGPPMMPIELQAVTVGADTPKPVYDMTPASIRRR